MGRVSSVFSLRGDVSFVRRLKMLLSSSWCWGETPSLWGELARLKRSGWLVGTRFPFNHFKWRVFFRESDVWEATLIVLEAHEELSSHGAALLFLAAGASVSSSLTLTGTLTASSSLLVSCECCDGACDYSTSSSSRIVKFSFLTLI